MELFRFLCDKYSLDESQLYVEYNHRPPPSLKGGRVGYYDGMLSYRKRNGHPEFLITVYAVSQNPLLTLAHEFAHLVKNLKSGKFDKKLEPPDDSAEHAFDEQAKNDLLEFESRQNAER